MNDPLTAAVSLQIAHPRYYFYMQLVSDSVVACVVSVYLVIVTTVLCSPCQQQFRIKLLASLRPTFFWRVQSQVTTATHCQCQLFWSDPRLVVVILLDWLIDCVLHSYRRHHYQSCDTARQRDSVRGRVRITCHVSRGTQFVASDCGELTLYTSASLLQRLKGNNCMKIKLNFIF